MSWFTDPHLFIADASPYGVYRIEKDFGSPVKGNDIELLTLVSFSECFFNLKDVGDVFKSPKYYTKFTNRKGLVIHKETSTGICTWSREEPNSPFWSLHGITEKESVSELEAQRKTVSELEATASALKDEVLKVKAAGKMGLERQSLERTVGDLEADILSLDNELQKENDEMSALIDDLGREKEERQSLEKKLFFLDEENSTLEDDNDGLEKKLSDLEAEKSSLNAMTKELTGQLHTWTHEVADVHKQLDREKKDKQALEKTVLDLTSKLEQCCGEGGSTDKEPWLSSSVVHSSWVPFQDLVPGVTRKSRPLAITKRHDFDEDYSTNVKASFFYQGMVNDRVMYPIVVVNVTELIPNGEKAKFDPNIWSLFNNAGTIYAARSPFPAPIRQ